ncbi:negative regulator of flagellin synthesis FlgM [Oceanisphaera litoralis]|uniref:flagellar biosynthesis anti-sigma factor FlgM n=1 Tax=Oceanisphaera litoralis TaxID=225144 RepID=UPI00195ED36B|nr:flagellar biosynthesis anti-sigma factor FlgM [Oceanisphaera litoralis]MBM7457287.1 negative regulator of flagellin synthesis FlgM [Oceanisphaera litoralis]
MAIDKLPPGLGNSTPLTGTQKYQASTTSGAPPSSGPTSIRQDEVTLTPQARRLNQMQQSLATTPAPDNSARLEALKKAINEGSYQVDSERLAANISRFEQDLEGL